MASDVTRFIKVTATATGNYSGAQTSTPTTTITAQPITAIAAISGTPQVGLLLTAGALTLAIATATYQWQSATTI